RAASLDAFCASAIGRDCLTATLLPACPAVRLATALSYDTAFVDTTADSSVLCRTECISALCQIAGAQCTRARLVESLRLALLSRMDSRCASVAPFDKPAGLLCAQLLAPPQSCAGLTTLEAASASLEAFCASAIGRDCLTATLLPACPAVRLATALSYDTGFVDTTADSSVLCRTECISALCQIAGAQCARARLVESLRLALAP
ncbi:hypothetical protein TSOC_013875, partial [Tetrabaena socialis]